MDGNIKIIYRSEFNANNGTMAIEKGKISLLLKGLKNLTGKLKKYRKNIRQY